MYTRFVVATISQQMRARVYTPSDGDALAYKVDDAFFRENPTRRVSIRESLPGELENGHDFANTTGLGGIYSRRPQLWMIVFSSGNGTYRAFPIWRGQQFFPVIVAYQGVFANVCNDAACLALFDECDMRGGVDAEAMAKWQREWDVAFAKVAANQQPTLSTTERIH